MSNNNCGEIIAIGGGGFGRNPHDNKIEKFILSRSSKKKPNICFIPTASAEEKSYIVNYYTAFSSLDCNPIHLNLFKRTPRLDSLINKQDIIYVGGGNTKSMLAVWREWKLDTLLLKHYKKGKILSGVSAGSICWFEKGVTDSWASNLNIIDCLGFLEGVSCPHYDGEKDRQPTVHNFINTNKISSCYASDDGSALHFKRGKLFQSVSFYKNANSYDISKVNNKIKEKIIKGISL